jgi:hypothetical protein
LKARYAAGGKMIKSDEVMNIGREFGYIVRGMRIKNPTDMTVPTVST